ncbi:MAG: aldo/keto reductase [Myxococcales bacterium]|nr:aldo/keto reductase [Myxococcales bacterium]
MQSYTVDNVVVPAFFYGTAWKEERTAELVRLARAAGFVAFDTANQRRHYLEAALGEALAPELLREPGARARLFLQTKYTYVQGQDHRLPYDPRAPLAEQVAQSCASSLAHLGVDFVDSYLLHGPASGRGLGAADWEVWRAMEELAASGKARLLGVSNVSPEQLVLLLRGARVKPAFVQNRCFARSGWDREVRAVCRDHGLLYQGFSLLTANGRELAAPAVGRIVARTGRTLPEVVFRFALALGIIPLTGTSRPEHMRADVACDSFALEPAELRALEDIAG